MAKMKIRCELTLRNTLLYDDKWSNITHLYITGDWNWNHKYGDYTADLFVREDVFDGLIRLEELRFVWTPRVTLYPGCFRGLDNLRILDLSDCVELGYDSFMSAFESDLTLPKLEQLILHMTGNKAKHFVFKDSFAKLLTTRPVYVLDISDMIIEAYDLELIGRYAKHLLFLNISGISVINFTLSNENIRNFSAPFKVLDASRSYTITSRVPYMLCMWPPYEYVISDHNMIGLIVETLYMDNLCGYLQKQ
ncbi:hypothetical protein DPMN_072138 [Dreissena polymorpha]|uniref:Uncharacterized protein n=1 Tax=Dreissena polymorpha TaxID=45954 RepID=A0A9D3Z437_DREPO|nr:hypothetical protein DPMN_072138 [Dreissena polymorpha]